MAEPVGDGVDAHVGEHPLGRNAVGDAQRVVEAVAARAFAQGLTDAEWHEIADDRERTGRHLEDLGQAHPQRCVAGALFAFQFPERPRARHARLEPIMDPSLVPVLGRARHGRVRRRHIRFDRPLSRERQRALPERADDGEDLLVADMSDDARLAHLMPAHDFLDVELEHARRTSERQELCRCPDARPSAELFHDIDRGAEPTPPEQRAGARRQCGNDFEPPTRLIDALEAEERARIHWPAS